MVNIMIKINSENILSSKKIVCIYYQLSNRVYDYISKINANVVYSYKNQPYNKLPLEKNEQISVIYNYLISKDFYNYKFDIEFGAVDDKTKEFIEKFLSLSSNCVIQSLTKKSKTKSEPIKDFYVKYSGTKFYDSLINDKEIMESKKLSESVKIDFINRKFPKYEKLTKLDNAFDYTYLNDKERHIVINELSLIVCPYCNLNYTLSYTKNNIDITTADLDHFYKKSKYKKYSLCLYNFVPSCPVCNSKLKSTVDMEHETHIFPNEDSFEGKAKFEISNIIDVQVRKQKAIIKMNVYYDPSKKAEKSLEVFQIDNLYQNFNSYANELLEKAIIYNETYQDELTSQLKNIFKQQIDLKSLVFGEELQLEDIANKSLGKLKRDLLKQFNIW